MPVVNLRHVGVIMQQRRMAVHVSMRLLDPQCLFMLVIVVVVVDVHVIMFHFLMAVRMGMMSSDKEYEANRHDSSRHGFTESPALTENGNRGQGADKGSRCQKSSLARGAMQTKGAHIQHQTHTVAEQTNTSAAIIIEGRGKVWPAMTARLSVHTPALSVLIRVTTMDRAGTIADSSYCPTPKRGTRRRSRRIPIRPEQNRLAYTGERQLRR
jgi:hypothetical protein